MATYVPAKRATELIFYLGLTSQSTGQFQTNPTLAAGDVKLSKDGGALANLTTLPAVTPAGSKLVKVTLSSTEMTADNVTVVFSDAAGAEWDDVIINIQTAARQIDDLLPTASYTAPDNATITSIQADTNDIQSRLPAALSGDGFMKADLKSIDDELTSGNNATLNLKKLNIINNNGDALYAQSTGNNGSGITAKGHGLADGVFIVGGSTSGIGIEIVGINESGVSITSTGLSGTNGITISSESGFGVSVGTNSGDAVSFQSTDGNALSLLGSGSGKSINAPQDIALPSGDLDDQLQALPTAAENADQVWEETLADHSGTVGSTAEQLAAAGAAGDPWGTALPGAYGAGTAGKIIGDNINATIASRSSHSAADVWAVGTRTLTSFGTLVTDIWSNATRTLTAISDSAGVTTLLSRIGGALNISGGKVESNVKQVNDTNITGDGSNTPWGPA